MSRVFTSVLLVLTLLMTGQGAYRKTECETGGLIYSGSVWGQTNIPTCFEDYSYNYPEYIEWAQSAAENSWEAVSAINFVGWVPCSEVNTSGWVRILIDEKIERSHVARIGRKVADIPDGMKLRTKYKFSPLCKTDPKLFFQATVVHEFGHILGLAHTQDRKDNNGRCLVNVNEVVGISIDKYDPVSTMNYCNPFYHFGILSCGDVKTVKLLYGEDDD